MDFKPHFYDFERSKYALGYGDQTGDDLENVYDGLFEFQIKTSSQMFPLYAASAGFSQFTFFVDWNTS